jgi:cytochrome c-type biogenesis protein CcmE
MNKRKILTIIVVAIILIATIFLIVLRVANGNKNNKNVEAPVSGQSKNNSNMFDVKNSSNAKMIEITGSVKEIMEKTMTITTAQGDVSVGINGATPVMLSMDKNVQLTVGQIADVRLNDSVDVQYDQNTKEAHLVTITQKASAKTATATKAVISTKK